MENRLYKAIKDPYWAFGVILRRTIGRWMNDRSFIRWEYFSGMGKFPDLDNPTTYNEKLQWLKLNETIFQSRPWLEGGRRQDKGGGTARNLLMVIS